MQLRRSGTLMSRGRRYEKCGFTAPRVVALGIISALQGNPDVLNVFPVPKAVITVSAHPHSCAIRAADTCCVSVWSAQTSSEIRVTLCFLQIVMMLRSSSSEYTYPVGLFGLLSKSVAGFAFAMMRSKELTSNFQPADGSFLSRWS